MPPINERLEQAIELIRHWPPERQEDAVRTLLALHKNGTSVYAMSEAERADISEGLRQAMNGERVDDKTMEGFYRSHGL